MVTALGGRYTRDFTNTVSHLIANEAGSEKHKVAAKLKIPTVYPHWVFDSYATVSLKDANDDKYKVKLFAGKNICVTGLKGTERTIVSQLIEKYGGIHSTALTKSCTHLVSNTTEGPKYAHAVQWNLIIVTPQWVYDTTDQGVYQTETLYCVPTVAPSDSDIVPLTNKSMILSRSDSSLSVPSTIPNTNTSTTDFILFFLLLFSFFIKNISLTFSYFEIKFNLSTIYFNHIIFFFKGPFLF
eukprot:TRINITY_DN15580_c0_g1_i1.p1 TRINITY_DN15580_c0_g1~~TRINITY_DN15580_c0_g1_i1.p1  ORF type:complete len:241 (-),score=34.20 TRINITY_DN15580_c0_g1_i1:62-784(-)